MTLGDVEESLPLIDLNLYLHDKTSEAALNECRKCADTLRDYGALVFRDPRVTEGANDAFLDQVEDYFGQPDEQKMRDTRSQYGYQVGATPELTESPRCNTDPTCQKVIADMLEDKRPHEIVGNDPKWRFFWRLGEQPPQTKFPQLNALPVIPEGFPYWAKNMDEWGSCLKDGVLTIAEMAAVGFGLPANTFTDLAKYGPHLLAPTATDLVKYGKVGTVFAGFHYDLNLLTIHGKSRYPGLHIWPRNGSVKIPVRVPDGCLLVQAGKQMEWLTGGTVLAGYHEVVCTEATMEAIAQRQATFPTRPLWRVSSTLFLHVASDNVLKPIQQLAPEGSEKKYPAVLAGDYVKAELSGIKLMK